MSILFLSLAAIFVLRGPLGRALADRLSGGGRGAESDEAIRELRAEVDQVKAELGAVQERLDFAERVLARPKGS